MDTILITRPEPAATHDAVLWRQSGFDVIVAPLLTVTFIPLQLPDLKKYDAIVTTSAQAVLALAQLTTEREFPLWCVGQASARVATDCGFEKIFTPVNKHILKASRHGEERSNVAISSHPGIAIHDEAKKYEVLGDCHVASLLAMTEKETGDFRSLGYKHSSPENAFNLADCIIKSLTPKEGRLLYARGKHVQFNMAEALTLKGFQVDQVILYETQPHKSSWQEMDAFFANPHKTGVTFYSKRTAQMFKEYAKAQPDFKGEKGCYALALSTEIADLIQLFFEEPAIIASTTTQLIANLKKVCCNP